MFHPAAGVVEGAWSLEANRTGRPGPRIIAPRMLTAKIIDCLFASIHSGIKIKPHLFIPLINADRYRKLHFQKKTGVPNIGTTEETGGTKTRRTSMK